MTKSKRAFRNISEVAEELGVAPSALRFWESRFPQIKPLQRGGGRRYYRPDDVALLAGIKRLLHDDGVTIRNARKILQARGVDHVRSLGRRRDADSSVPRPSETPDGFTAKALPAAEEETALPPTRERGGALTGLPRNIRRRDSFSEKEISAIRDLYMRLKTIRDGIASSIQAMEREAG